MVTLPKPAAGAAGCPNGVRDGVVTLPNPASAALHEAVGFKPFAVYRDIGFKNGAWHDVGWWECDLAEKLAIQPEPVLLTELGYRPGGLFE